MTFLEIIILIFAIALSIIAIRLSLKFDVNQFLENRRKIKLDQLKNICPHIHISPQDSTAFILKSYFSSPRGTSKWFCSQCGLVVESQEDVNRLIESYKKDINLYLKKQKRFINQAKKLKLV